MRVGASLAMEGFGPAATSFGSVLLWQGDGLALGAAKGLAQLPVPSFPGGFLLSWTCWMGGMCLSR